MLTLENITKDIIGLKMSEGLDPGTFRDILYKMIREKSYIRNTHETVSAVEFEYTFWSKPDNKTAVRQNLIDVSFTRKDISCNYNLILEAGEQDPLPKALINNDGSIVDD